MSRLHCTAGLLPRGNKGAGTRWSPTFPPPLHTSGQAPEHTMHGLNQ